MVDALSEIHRVLAPRGILIDARPDSRVFASAGRRRPHSIQRFGIIKTQAAELAADRAAGRAIAAVLRRNLFSVRRSGRLWHEIPFDGLAELRDYLSEHMRFVHRATWVVDAATRRRYARETFVIRRAVRYSVLQALP